MIFPVKRSIKIFGTDSFDMSLTWKDPDGNPYSLTGWYARFTFFVAKDDRTIVKMIDSLAATLALSRVTLSSVAPNIYVFVKADETQIGTAPDFTQEPGYFTLDIAPLDLDDTVYRLMEGRVHYEL